MSRTDETQDQPGWTAHWCWTRKHVVRPWNQFVAFRRTVELPFKPVQALVQVSADARYTLFVNGKRVHSGPARSFPEMQAYDTLDLTDFLEAGKNAICVICHQFGTPTFFHVYRDISGFILDGVILLEKQTIPLNTPDDWLCREMKGWRRDVVRMSVQLGFQEHFDADADPANWMLPEYEPIEKDGWFKPWNAGPVGVWPWIKMEERIAPLLASKIHNFASVLSEWRGENARGYKTVDDVYHLPLGETRKKDKDLIADSRAMLLRSEDQYSTVAPPGDGNFTCAVLDLGTYRSGHLVLDITEAAGDEIIDVIYAEDLDNDGFPLILGSMGGTGGCQEATATRYRCRPGAQEWESFHYIGLRYVAVIFRNLTKPLKVRHIGIRQVHAGFEEIGSFECSDEKLNKIWQVGKNTQLNCAFDTFVDCPWREQAMWWGDARVQARVTAFAFGDYGLLERGIRLMARSQGPDGSLHSHPPADIPGHRLPDFMLTWVGTIWDHYFNTGKIELVRDCLPAMHRMFEFFEEHEVLDGLIGGFDGWWVFLDWQPLFKGDVSGVLNLAYLRALRTAAALCEMAHDENALKKYSAKIAQVSKSVEKYFWDAKGTCWRDGWDVAKNEPVDQTSQHMHALAILLRLKPQTHTKIARDVLFKPAKAKKSKVITGSPFFYAYILEAMIESGMRAEAIDIIREKWWDHFIAKGATTFYEGWEVTTQSRCHAWSASPVYHLMEQVLGVTPVNIGWKHVRIAPFPAAGLDFARGVVPSPLGPIKVEWEKAGDDQLALHIELPPGMQGEFTGPLGETRTLKAGKHEFHT